MKYEHECHKDFLFTVWSMSKPSTTSPKERNGRNRGNSLVPVGKLHHHIQRGNEKHEVEEAIAVCHMLSLIIVDPHPMAVIIIAVFIISSLVLLFSCGGIGKAGVTAQSTVSLHAIGEKHTYTDQSRERCSPIGQTPAVRGAWQYHRIKNRTQHNTHTHIEGGANTSHSHQFHPCGCHGASALACCWRGRC